MKSRKRDAKEQDKREKKEAQAANKVKDTPIVAAYKNNGFYKNELVEEYRGTVRIREVTDAEWIKEFKLIYDKYDYFEDA